MNSAIATPAPQGRFITRHVGAPLVVAVALAAATTVIITAHSHAARPAISPRTSNAVQSTTAVGPISAESAERHGALG